jgi:RNA polymerase sigma factor (sigma-70 family)
VHDARDAEDSRLLVAGDHKQLVVNYLAVIRERCRLRLRSEDAADEATQIIVLRLLDELGRRKRYPVPFRVVVHNVTTWVLRGFSPAAKDDVSLPDWWEQAGPDEMAAWEEDYDLGLLLDGLPTRQSEVAMLIYREGLTHEQAAERLGITRNAVDQALHNAHVKLGERLR